MSSSKLTVSTVAVTGVTTAIVLSVSVAACLHLPWWQRPQHVPTQFRVAINASASNSFQLGLSIYLASRLSGMMDVRDQLKVYRVDVVSRPVFEGAPADDTDKFRLDLVEKLQALAKETGTHSLGFWQDAGRKLVPNRPVTLIYFTDGFEENSTADEIRELQDTGRLLAANQNVRAVYLLGVNPKMNALWNSVFHDLGGRLHLQGPLNGSSIAQIEAAADGKS